MDLRFSFAYAESWSITDAIVNLRRGACLKTLGIPRRHGHAWRTRTVAKLNALVSLFSSPTKYRRVIIVIRVLDQQNKNIVTSIV
jgi:hypothetical protein